MHSLPEVKEKIQGFNRLALFLDFDGTLSPIVADPKSAELPEPARQVLELLARHPSMVVTLISGRAVEDLYVRIRLEGLIYAGNHGLEIFGRNLTFVEPIADARRGQMRRLTEVVAAKLRHIKGVHVEDKGLTTSVHFRNATDEEALAVEDAVRASVAAAGDLFRMNTGRRAFDIVPRTSWNKGAAAVWIMRHVGEDGLLPVYLGDDPSDEEAFSVLTGAVTVRVGEPSATIAQYHIPDPDTTVEFLTWIHAQARVD